MSSILVIDDEKEICHFLRHLLEDKGHKVSFCMSGAEFDRIVEEQPFEFELAFLDIRLPDRNGLDLLQKLKTLQPYCKVIIMTGYSTVKTAVEAIKLGANDFLEKPFDQIEDIENLAEQLLANGASPIQNHIHRLAEQIGCFIGRNKEMNQLFSLAYKFAQKNITVLIEGETGTGKEVLAHFIHHASLRKEYPFIGVNCGAISENLLESELFGHTRGAFTGAAKERKGYFELAGKGTLFLDEIGEAALSTQVKLLRVLETGEFIKVGGEHTQRSQARMIAASHVNLHEAVSKGTFREDLLYRLDVVKLTIPPLRERLDDIPLFIENYLERNHVNVTFTQETIDLLTQYSWPGNVRELVNVIKRAVTLAEGETTLITPDFLPPKFTRSLISPAKERIQLPSRSKSSSNQGFGEYLHNWQKELRQLWNSEEVMNLEAVLSMIKSMETEAVNAFIHKALTKTVGNRKEAVDMLGISMRKLRYYLNEKNK